MVCSILSVQFRFFAPFNCCLKVFPLDVFLYSFWWVICCSSSGFSLVFLLAAFLMCIPLFHNPPWSPGSCCVFCLSTSIGKSKSPIQHEWGARIQFHSVPQVLLFVVPLDTSWLPGRPQTLPSLGFLIASPCYEYSLGVACCCIMYLFSWGNDDVKFLDELNDNLNLFRAL